MPTSHRTLWLLIAEDGGRLTNGFDAQVINEHGLPLKGSYGPFGAERRRLRREVSVDSMVSGTPDSAQATASSGSAQAVGPAQAFGGGAIVTGFARYNNMDVQPAVVAPVGNTEVQVECFGKSDPFLIEYDLYYLFYTSTNISGGFTASCNAGFSYIEGYVRLRNSAMYAAGPNNAAAGVWFSGFDGESFNNLMVANDNAAHTYLTARQWPPVVNARFGRSRPRPYYEVSEVGGPTHYDQVADLIRIGEDRVYTEDGLFVAVHEYAHAFHWVAIEPPRAYSCTENEHFFTEVENASCAFVEGFADFVALWVLGGVFQGSPFGGDDGLEANLYLGNPANNLDGRRVEATVAAFLYDLADGAGELDSPSNTADGDDDAIQIPASWIADVIEFCQLSFQYFSLAGADELVYCMEKSGDARLEALSLGFTWPIRVVSGWDQTVTTYDQSIIRDLWKLNFYGQ